MISSWEKTKLGNVIQLVYGKPLPTEKRKQDGLYPIYGANGEIGRTDEFYYDQKSIIVGRKGSAGELNLTEEKFWPLDVTYFVTFDIKKYDLSFLFFLLSSLNLTSMAKGVKPGINRNDVYAIDVSIPTLPEQQRIVAILDEAFDVIDKAKRNYAHNITNSQALFNAQIDTLLSKNKKNWKETTLGNICSFENGDRGKNYPSKLHRVNHGIPFINAGHLTGYGINFEKMDFISRERYNLLGSGKIKKGDLLFCLRGSLGKVAFIDDMDEGAIASSLVIVRPSEMVLKDFLLYYFHSKLCNEMILSFGNGAAQPNLSAGSLKKFQIVLPPINEQEQIIENLKALQSEINSLEILYENKIKDLDELKMAISQKVFSRK